MEEIKKYSELVTKHFKELDKNIEPIVFYVNWGYSFFDGLLTKKTKKNKFKLSEIKPIASDIPVVLFESSSSYDEKENKKKKERKKATDRTGLYQFEFIEGENKFYITYCCFLNSINEQMYVFASSQEVVDKIHLLRQEETLKQLKPNVGIFTGHVDDRDVLRYSKYEEQISKKITYHKVKKDITEDIQYFFKNVERSINNDEKGTRKILIAGVQGTGKSSFINELILSYKETHSILICTDMKMLVKHTQLCGRFEVPCISILEDCENHLDDRNSNLLNYLSGALEPKNVKGSYTIMTTNYPQALSDRIKARPERIDDVFILSYLDENDALDVTKYYFSKFLPADFNYETLRGVFPSATGAEIMKYAQDVKKAADYQHGDFSKIDTKFIKKVLNSQKDKYKKLGEINTSKTASAKATHGFSESIGFGQSWED